jgi:hypothetical protein
MVSFFIDDTKLQQEEEIAYPNLAMIISQVKILNNLAVDISTFFDLVDIK